MGKLKLSDIEIQNIDKFLSAKEFEATPGLVEFAAYLNAIALAGAWYCTEHKILWGVVLWGLALTILGTYFYYSKNYERNARYTYLYLGSYSAIGCLCFGFLSSVCLKAVLIRNVELYLLLIGGCLAVAISSYVYTKRKIASGHYGKEGTVLPTNTLIGAIGGIGGYATYKSLRMIDWKI